MKTKFKEVKRLEEIKNHFWFDDDWRPVITMLSGFHQGEPNREPNTEKDIRGPVSKDINFNPLDLVEAIRDKTENPDDIFHQMLLLSAETIGEIDRDTRESERFKKRYKAIEKELWDEMIQLLREEQDELYKNVELAFGVCMVDNNELIDNLIGILDDSDTLNKRRSIDVLGYVSYFSEKAAIVTAEKALDKIIEILMDEDSIAPYYPCRAIGKITEGLSESTIFIAEKAIEKIVKLMEDNDWKIRNSTFKKLREISKNSYRAAWIIADKAVDKIIALLDYNDDSVHIEALEDIRKISEDSPEATKIIADKAMNKILELMVDMPYYASRTLESIAAGSLEAARIIAEKSASKIIEMLRYGNDPYDAITISRKFIRNSLASRIIADKLADKIVLFVSDKNRTIRFEAVETLKEIAASSPEASKIVAYKTADIIIKMLEDDDKQVCYYALEASNRIMTVSPGIAKFIGEKGIDKLIEVFLSNQLFQREETVLNFFEKTIKYSSRATRIIVDKMAKKLKNDDLVFLYNSLLISRRIKSSSPERARYIVEKIIDNFMEFLEIKNWNVPKSAIKIFKLIAKMPIKVRKNFFDKAANKIVRKFNNKKLNISESSIEVLGIIGESSSEAAIFIANNAKDKIKNILELLEDKNSYIRKITLEFLAIITEKSSVDEKIIKEISVDVFLKLLKDNDYGVHMKSVDLLGKIASGSSEAANFFTTEAIDKILEMLKDKESFIRGSVIYILGKIASGSSEMARYVAEKSIDNVVMLLEDEALYVRNKAIKFIENIIRVCQESKKNIVNIELNKLLKMLNSKNYSSRLRNYHISYDVIKTIGMIGKHSLELSKIIADKLPDKIAALYQKHSFSGAKIIFEARSVLTTFASTSTEIAGILAKQIIKMMKSQDLDDRKNAVVALILIGINSSITGKIVAEKAIKEIVLLLEDNNSFIRKKVLDILGDTILDYSEAIRIMRNKALDRIVPLIVDKDSEVCSGAISILGKIASKAPKFAVNIADKTTEKLILRMEQAYKEGKIGDYWIFTIITETLEKIGVMSSKAALLIAEKAADKLIGFMNEDPSFKKTKVTLRQILKKSKIIIIKSKNQISNFHCINKKSIIKTFRIKDNHYYLVSKAKSEPSDPSNVSKQTSQKSPKSQVSVIQKKKEEIKADNNQSGNKVKQLEKEKLLLEERIRKLEAILSKEQNK